MNTNILVRLSHAAAFHVSFKQYVRVPRAGSVKPKGQKSFQVFPGNVMTLGHLKKKKKAEGWGLQTWSTKRFPNCFEIPWTLVRAETMTAWGQPGSIPTD